MGPNYKDKAGKGMNPLPPSKQAALSLFVCHVSAPMLYLPDPSAHQDYSRSPLPNQIQLEAAQTQTDFEKNAGCFGKKESRAWQFNYSPLLSAHWLRSLRATWQGCLKNKHVTGGGRSRYNPLSFIHAYLEEQAGVCRKGSQSHRAPLGLSDAQKKNASQHSRER